MYHEYDNHDNQFDFFDEIGIDQNELFDCYLEDSELNDFLTPPTEIWKDFLSVDNPTVVTMDSAKSEQWNLAKEEIEHVRKSIIELLEVDDFSKVNDKGILMLCIGPESKVGEFLKEELSLCNKEYLRFMNTLCIQSAYHISSRQIFHSDSLLKDKVLMSEAEYNEVWKIMSEKKRIHSTGISTSRRAIPLWESIETIVIHFISPSSRSSS